MDKKQQTILAVGGHVGDMELTAGALLATQSLRGDKIVTLAMTAGEKGAPSGQSDKEYRIQKLDEAKKFADMLGGQSFVLDYPDGELPDNDEARMLVCDIIREVRPDVMITHFQNSMHKDHSNTHKIAVDARFYAGNPFFERKLPAFSVPKLYFAENWEDSVGFHPFIYVDVTEGFELWKKAVSTHWFVTGSTSFPYLEYYEHLSRLRGIEMRRERAECFTVEEDQLRVFKESL